MKFEPIQGKVSHTDAEIKRTRKRILKLFKERTFLKLISEKKENCPLKPSGAPTTLTL